MGSKASIEEREMRAVNWFIRLLTRIDLYFTGHYTYCDGCKRFSPGTFCPYC
jgi:hypothetical protein